MSVRIMVGYEYGDGQGDDAAVLYDSLTGIPLPIEMFAWGNGEVEPGHPADRAERFLENAGDYFDRDIRQVPPNELRDYQARWFKGETPSQREDA